ncbi:MAG TPA: GxxExxY protein [Cyclobacteriaceae bacterium]|nr:GxxExxY protein [Cyclobacteriaceae bacterium]
MNLFESELTAKVIGCAIEVHRAFGPCLLESAYRECLFHELKLNGLSVEREKPMPIIYKGIKLDHGYRMDLVVENKLVIETKTVEIFTDVHFEQLMTYPRLGSYPIGLLINLHVKLLKHGIQRIINTI